MINFKIQNEIPSWENENYAFLSNLILTEISKKFNKFFGNLNLQKTRKYLKIKDFKKNFTIAITYF